MDRSPYLRETRRFAGRPWAVGLAVLSCACGGDVASLATSTISDAGDQRPSIVFLSDAPASKLPAEEAAAWEWLQSRQEFAAQSVQFVDLAEVRLPRNAVLWWHYAAEESLPSAAVDPQRLGIIRSHLRSGGSMLLSLLATPYVVPLGLESAAPDTVMRDASFLLEGERFGGLQSRLGHPLLRRFFGGVFTASTGGATARPAALYTGDRWPVEGRVWAVHKSESEVVASTKVGVQYAAGTTPSAGTLLTLGAHCYFSDADNRVRAQLEQLLVDALFQLADRPGAAAPEVGEATLDNPLQGSAVAVAAAADGVAGPAERSPVERPASVRDGQSRYWQPQTGRIVFDAASPGAGPATPPAPGPDGAVLNVVAGSRSGAELLAIPSQDAPFTLSSPTTSVGGSQLGRVDGLWAHPWQVLSNLRFGIVRAERGVTWLDDRGEHQFTARPEGVELRYLDGDIQVNLHLTVSREDAAMVVLLAVRSPAPVDVIATWDVDLSAGWPRDPMLHGPLVVGWNDRSRAVTWHDEAESFGAMAGFGGQEAIHILGFDPDRHLGEEGLRPEVSEPSVSPTGDGESELGADREPSGQADPAGDAADPGATVGAATAGVATAGVATQVHLEAGRPALLTFVAVAGDPAAGAIEETFNRTAADPGRNWSVNADYFRDFLGPRTLGLLVPDREFEDSFKWAKLGAEQLTVTAPGVGTGIFSGYGPRRPVDPHSSPANVFGGASLWASMAADAYGDEPLAADTLRLLARYQDIDGRIPSAVAPSWQLRYDGLAATPMFLIALENHIRTWGNRNLLEDLWPAAVAALDSTFAADRNDDGRLDSFSRLDRWNADADVATTIHINALWGAALDATARMAVWMDDDEQAGRCLDRLEIVRQVLNEDFWDPFDRGFYFGQRLDGTSVDTRTVLPAVPMIFGLLETGPAIPALDSIASAGLSSDVGVALAAAAEPAAEAASATAGIAEVAPTGLPDEAAERVSPLFTGWASLAEYANHRAESGFAHAATNLKLLRYHNLGRATRTLTRSDFDPDDPVSHAAGGQALTILPVVWGMLGIRPDAMENTLEIVPHLPAGWPRVIASPVHVGDNRFRIQIRQSAERLQFAIERLDGNDPVVFRLGAHVPSDVAVALDGEPQGATIEAPEVVEEYSVDHGSLVAIRLQANSTTVTFRHDVFPRLLPQPLRELELQPGRESRGLRVIRARYLGGTLGLSLEGLPGRTYPLRLATPWPVSEVTGAPEVSAVNPEPGRATIQVTIPGSGNRYRPLELEVSFRR